MASDVEDTDLDALRSAVLASLKTRGIKEADVEESSKNDAELEELRKAALRSKRFAENNNKTPVNSSLQMNFQSNRGFRKDFPHRTGHNLRPNLIVIQPVQNEGIISNGSFTKYDKPKDEESLLTAVPQRVKNSGKFSRFESDSDSSTEESEDELSDEDLDAKTDSETDDEEEGTKETDEENVLLLHPDEELPDSECTLQSHDSNIEIAEEDSAVSEMKTSQSVESSVKRRVKDRLTNDRDKPRSGGKSSRHSERHSRPELGSIKENSESSRLSDHRLEVKSRNGERRRHRNDGDARKDKEKRDKTIDESFDRQIERHRTKHAKERLGVSCRNGDDLSSALETVSSQHRSKFCVVGDDRMPSIVVTSHCRRRRKHRSNSVEREMVNLSPRDSSRSSDSKVLRSRNSSPTAQPLDLRNKLRLRKRQKDMKEGIESSDHRGNERRQRSSSEEEDVDPYRKRSLTKRDRTAVVRSVLSVVKVTPASTSEVRSKSRSPLPMREEQAKSSQTLRRKSGSPIESERTSKTRKIIVIDEKSGSRLKKRLKSPHIDITITDDAVERSCDSSPVRRIPVRQRLGIQPKSCGSFNVRGSSPTTHHGSISPQTLTERRSTSPSSTASSRTEPKRKVKLRRDVFASPSGDLKHALSSDKSRIQKGRPTFENELDERIRRIQANNEAILKRKYEIAWDQHKHN